MSEGGVLSFDPVDLVEPCQFHRWDPQLILQILRGESRLRIQNQIEIGFCHFLKFLVRFASSDLPYSADTGLFKQFIQFRIIIQRCKKAHDIDRRGSPLALFQHGINTLTHMHHGWLPSFPCQRIHIAGLDPDAGLLLCPAADSFHIRAQQRIHAGDADHHNCRFLFQTVHHFLYGIRDHFQVTPGDEIRFIHHQIKIPMMIRPHGTDGGGISSTAARCYQQHNRLRHCQGGTFNTEAFRSGRIECQRRRRAVNEMRIGDQFRRDLLFAHLCQLLGSIVNGFAAHDCSSSSISSFASSMNFWLIGSVGSASITVIP